MWPEFLASLWTDPELSTGVTYTPVGGTSASARAIVTQTEPATSFFQVGARTPGYRVELQVVEVPARPLEGATIEGAVVGLILRVRTALNLSELLWECACDVVVSFGIPPSEGPYLPLLVSPVL